MSQTKSRSVSAARHPSPWARCAAWRRYSRSAEGDEHEPAQDLNGHAMVLHRARDRADAQRRAQRDQARRRAWRPSPAAIPPQKPRSIARWMQSTLTGPTGAGDKNSDDDADRNDERVRQKMHSRSLVSHAPRREGMRGAGVALLKSPRNRPRRRHRSRTPSSAAPPLAPLELADAASRRVMLKPLVWYWYWRGFSLSIAARAGALEGRGRAPRHRSTAPARAAEGAQPPAAKEKPLPGAVEEMREAILAAALSGRIEELRVPLDWNEMKPDVAPNG